MTSRGPLENRPEVLRRLADGLWSDLEEGRPLTQGQLEAAVEAGFRIGVHPATEPATALTMLTRAHRLDGTNPKHPYHVGLLYLRHGRPEAAVPWFTAAAALSPGNHRVWAHLSLAYRTMGRQGESTDGDHRSRAETIAATVREGRHDFLPVDEESAVPAEDGEGAEGGASAAARPLLRPGVCRWTGIHDMTADSRLRGNTTTQTRDVLAAELESIADLSGRRPGRTAAFSVLAVQWMVYGYPTATVRRLAKRLPPDDGPATRMLHLVCDLFDADLHELPDRLAECLSDRSLPDVLIALIHRRRLFRRPLAFPDPGAHAAAREFTDGDPERHEKAMRSAVEQLAAEPAEPMADVAPPAGPDAPGPPDPDGRLAFFEQTAASLTGLATDARAHAKDLAGATVADAAGYARVAGDRDVLTDLLERLEAVRQTRLEELQRFQDREPSGLVMAFEEFQRRLGACQASFQEPLGSLRTILNKRVAKRLAAKERDFGTTEPAPGQEALTLRERLSALETDPAGTPPPDDRLALLEETAARLAGLAGDALDHAKALARTPVTEEPDYARVLGDQELLLRLVDRLEAVRLDRLEAVQDLKAAEASANGLVMPFAEFHRRVEECETRFQEGPGGLRNILNKRVRKNLAPGRAEFAQAAPAPSPAARALAERLTALDSAPGTPPAGPTATVTTPPAPRPSPPPPDAQAGPRERVRHALAVAEQALDANFAEAWRTLERYPAGLGHRDAVVMLRTYLGGRQAESDQRLGRSAAARRGWNAMLSDDPLHPAVLRNLAVAHTTAGDLGQAAHAWRRHLEALYLGAVLDGDLRRGAAERAELHRVLAASFGTAPLCPRATDDRETEQETAQVVPLLASAGKVTATVAHLRLEELNHMLSQRGPTLLLGVGRSVEETELAAARDRRKATVEATVRLLPPRTRAGFRKLCDELIDEAYEAASTARGRTRRAGDEAEEGAHLEWARDRILWKHRLAGAVQGPASEWPLTEYSGDVLAGLRLVDSLPLDPADPGLLVSAQKLGLRGDAGQIIERYNRLTEHACDFALGCIHEAAEQAASGPATRHFSDRFRRMTRSWGRNDDVIPERWSGALDDPQRLYHPSAESAFAILERLRDAGRPADERERGILTAAVTALERWVERLPGATGPARTLAVVLSALDRHDEARRVLDQALREAFSARGRRQVALSQVRLDITRGKFAEAVDRVRELLLREPDEVSLRRLLVEAYHSWITSGRDVPEASVIAAELARWTDAETVRDRRTLVVKAVLAKDRSGLDPVSAARSVAEDLRRVCEDDPDNVGAREQHVAALYRHAVAVRTGMRSTTGRERATLGERLKTVCAQCADSATGLLDSGLLTDEERSEQIRGFLRAVRPEEPPDPLSSRRA
ncbi:tetratricopeptide (TPR) repeat protein [Streptomyces luteogriseus]|uniref:Tetratricopeptide (TPR) repeat protein n=1 Tax=Streptomyces luteogriseus TaxID=68233 RepID=A0A7W7DKN1_9ACTN|nr:hypothetical protein [Streptomyces luteogriseus]MBB4711779.1 tetratricopeptide (TPR) repeat protein [Streptomyces luteogriseus]